MTQTIPETFVSTDAYPAVDTATAIDQRDLIQRDREDENTLISRVIDELVKQIEYYDFGIDRAARFAEIRINRKRNQAINICRSPFRGARIAEDILATARRKGRLDINRDGSVAYINDAGQSERDWESFGAFLVEYVLPFLEGLLKIYAGLRV